MSIYEKAGIALVPSGYKASKLYSTLPKNGVGDFDFTRATTATRVNSDGLIESVGSNEPRLDYPIVNGVVQATPSLLLEPARTNLVTYSEDFSNAIWNTFRTYNVNITTTNTLNPKGEQGAYKIASTNADNQFASIYTIVSGQSYSNSIYVKRVLGSGDIILRNVNNVEVNFQVNINDGWKRINTTVISDSTNGRMYLSLANSGDEIEVWGAQLEAGSYPTSYIPTSGSTVTRNADVANGAGDASTFNDSEGVFFAEISALTKDGGESRRITISDGSTNNRVSIELDETEGLLKLFQSGNGTLSQLTANLDVSQTFKVLASYNSDRVKLYINGFLISQDLSIVLPIGLNDLSFNSGTNASEFYGNTKQIMTFKEALTDAELENLTSWDSFIELAQGQQYIIY